MADKSPVKISQLPEPTGTGINDSDIFAASRITGADKLETQRITVSELRKLMDYGNAFSDLNAAIAATVKDQQFYVFVDDSKEFVYRYVNMGGIASPVLDMSGNPLREPTKELVKHLEQIRSSVGFGLIGQIKSFDELRATEPTFPGQRVLLSGYREGANYGGGEFFHDVSDKNAADNSGTVAVTPGGARWKRVIVDTSTNHAEWWGVHYSQADNAIALKKAADASRKKILMLPQGSNANPIVIRTPIVFQTNCGIKLRGCGVKDSTTISVQIGPGYETYGALHFPGRNPTTNAMEAGFAGIEISNIQLLGNMSTCRGIYLQYQYQSLFSYVNVERFNGAGLYLDKSQDSDFNFFNVWDCGRTSGDRTSNVDTFDMTKTVESPIVAVSTISNDFCNYLRFNDCQFEDNHVCPVMDLNWGIENYINNCHVEFNANWDIKGAPTPYFLKMQQGVTKINGGGIAEYQGIQHNYGELYLRDVRCSPGIVYTMLNDVTSRAEFHGISFYSIPGLARKRFTKFEYCNFSQPVTLAYPNSDIWFDKCTFVGDFTTTHAGADLRMTIRSCYFGANVTIADDTTNVFMDGCYITGDANYGSGGGMWGNNKVLGTFTQTSNGVRWVTPTFKQVVGTSAPTTGSFRVGDLCWNTAPTAGGVTHWRCVTAGSPGTWRAVSIVS
ncbi:amylovoran biosynthesis protein [Serratia phage vB_SmaM-Kodama]|uniref:Putative head binding protein n=1 Tax=Serratia phage vB_SmaM_Yaphecito TaxID=2777368 RepID=A0A7T3NC34_9CAUD|nr:putative head binding protein [Serratia phage vB_SmaM_Yaphecito]UQT03590.1 amylovoran biosynthesis protein [Serratia phage vB_SmaM-Kodama]